MLSLRFDAEAVVSYLFAVGDGFALQALSDPSATTAPRSPPAPPRPATCSSPSSLASAVLPPAWMRPSTE